MIENASPAPEPRSSVRGTRTALWCLVACAALVNGVLIARLVNRLPDAACTHRAPCGADASTQTLGRQVVYRPAPASSVVKLAAEQTRP